MKPGDANNAMINATGKNGVNHGVKEPPNRVQSPCCSCSFLKIQTILIQQEVVDIHDYSPPFWRKAPMGL